MSGVRELLALRLFSGQEMHGHEFVKAVRVVTAEAIAPGEVRVAGIGEGRVAESPAKADQRPHPGLLAVTPKGRQRLRRLTEEWDRISAGIESALRGAGQA